MKRPLMTLSISLVLGVLTGLFIDIAVICKIGLFIAIAGFVKLLFPKRIKLSKTKITLAVLVVIFFLYGLGSAIYKTVQPLKALSPLFNEKVTISGEITDVTPSGTYKSLTLKPDVVIKGGKVFRPNTKIHISLFESKKEFTPCSKVLLIGTVKRIDGPDFYGDFNAFSYYASKGIFGSISVLDEEIVILPKKQNVFSIKYAGFSARGKISKILSHYFDEHVLALTERILTGQTTKNDDNLSKRLQASGISHITSVSGQHVGYFFLFTAFLLFFTDVRNKKFLFLSLAPLVLYSIIIGFTPSLMRAVIMTFYSTIVIFLRRKCDGLTSLLVSTAVLCIINPYTIMHTGFLFSFFSVLALITVSYFYKKQRGNTPRLIFTIILTPLVVLIFIAPIIAKYYYTITIASVFTSIATSPFVILIMLAGYILFMLPITSPVTIPIISVSAKIILQIAKIFSKLPFLSIAVPSPSFKIILAYAFFIMLVIFILSKMQTRAYITAFVLVYIITYTGVEAFILRDTSRITVLPSKTAEAICIETENNENILINLYNNSENYLKSRNIKKLDALFATQISAEFYESLTEILEFATIEKIYIPNKDKKDETALNLDLVARKNKIKIYEYNMYDTINVADTKVNVLYNKRSESQGSALKIICDKTVIISTASISKEGKLHLLKKKPKCNIFVTENANDRTATAPYIVLSGQVGEVNSYKKDTSVFNTRKIGDITFYAKDGFIYDNFLREECLPWQ